MKLILERSLKYRIGIGILFIGFIECFVGIVAPRWIRYWYNNKRYEDHILFYANFTLCLDVKDVNVCRHVPINTERLYASQVFIVIDMCFVFAACVYACVVNSVEECFPPNYTMERMSIIGVSFGYFGVLMYLRETIYAVNIAYNWAFILYNIGQGCVFLAAFITALYNDYYPEIRY